MASRPHYIRSLMMPSARPRLGTRMRCAPEWSATMRNMLAAGFYSHMKEMYPVYMEKEGSDKRMILDYVAGMTDNFSLDCANEILKPEHLNDEINQSQTGKWFDVKHS